MSTDTAIQTQQRSRPIIATEMALIGLLKQGHPLPGDILDSAEDTVRLPVFKEVRAFPSTHIVSSAPLRRIILAAGRRECWVVDVHRVDRIGESDTGAMLAVMDHLAKTSRQFKDVRGWLVVTGTVPDAVRTMLRARSIHITTGASKR